MTNFLCAHFVTGSDAMPLVFITWAHLECLWRQSHCNSSRWNSQHSRSLLCAFTDALNIIPLSTFTLSGVIFTAVELFFTLSRVVVMPKCFLSCLLSLNCEQHHSFAGRLIPGEKKDTGKVAWIKGKFIKGNKLNRRGYWSWRHCERIAVMKKKLREGEVEVEELSGNVKNCNF